MTLVPYLLRKSKHVPITSRVVNYTLLNVLHFFTCSINRFFIVTKMYGSLPNRSNLTKKEKKSILFYPRVSSVVKINTPSYMVRLHSMNYS